MNPLESALLKAHWAHIHLHALYDDVERVLGPKDKTVIGEFDPLDSCYVFRRELTDAQRKKWALMLGDAAVNLRASLDHIAYQFRLEGVRARDLERITFPILDKPNKGTLNMLSKNVKPAAVEKIQEFQPYITHIDAPWKSPLFVVSELTRMDKHRSLAITVDTISWQRGDNWPEDAPECMGADNTGIIAVLNTPFDPQKEFKLKISLEPHFELTIPNEEPIGHFNFAYLHDAYNLIVNEVFPAFARILETEGVA